MLPLVGLPALVALTALGVSRAAAGTVASTAWNVAWTAAAVGALAGMLAARHCDPARRSGWTYWAAATASWLAGQVAWDVYSVTGSPSSPNLADAGWWGFAVLVIAGLLRPDAGSRAVRTVGFVEALPLVAAAMALTFAELWTTVAASPLPALARAATLAYPVVYVTASVLTLQAIVGGWLRRFRAPGPHLVLAGVVTQSAAFILWSEELLEGTYVTGATLVDSLWLVGMLTIGAGGALASAHDERDVADEEPSRRGGVLPSATFVLLIAALMRAQVAGAPLGARVTLAVGLLLSGATLIARGILLDRRLRDLLARERSARQQLAAREADLARSNEQLAEDLRRDALTGMRNRWALAQDLPLVEQQARERDEPFALALCDFDHFKAYNDRLGHLAGDQALRALCATIRNELRAGDAAYRFGGEEVLLVLGDVRSGDAVAVADRIRRAVSRAAMPHPAGIDGIVTISVGVAAGTVDAGALLAAADAALYRAKSEGRNRVVGASDAATPAAAAPARARATAEQHPLLRHLRSMAEVTRAAMAGADAAALLERVGATIRSELLFQTVAVNLLDPARRELRVVAVLGEDDARTHLLGTTSPWSEWERLLTPDAERRGAFWLPAGARDLSAEIATWTPLAAAALRPDQWHPDDLLILPLRDAGGDIVGVVSVDEPRSGLRPSDADLDMLMAVADHAALALEQAERRVTRAVAV